MKTILENLRHWLANFYDVDYALMPLLIYRDSTLHEICIFGWRIYRKQGDL